VSGTGLVTHVGAGTAEILATYQAKTAGQAIAVVGLSKVTITGLTCSAPASTSEMAVPLTCTSADTGGTTRLSATASYTNEVSRDVTTRASWTTSDASVFTVDQSGVVTAAGFGDATVTATFGNLAGSQLVRSPGSLSTSDDLLRWSSWGGQVTIMIGTSPSNVPWRIDSDVSWLTVEPSSGSGSMRVLVKAGSHRGWYRRAGHLTVSATKGRVATRIVAVVQDEYDPY
jgi:hypothetical protein